MIDQRLKIFIEVAETGHFTKAANNLFISQPAVSSAIKSLERELDALLLYRDRKNGVKLTSSGEKILSLAKELSFLENEIYQTVLAEKGMLGGTLRIASLPVLTATLLADTLQRFNDRYPNVKVEIMEDTPSAIYKMIRNRTVDIGLSCAPFDGLDHVTIVHDRMIGIYSPNKKDPPSVIDLKALPETFIAVKAASETAMELSPVSLPPSTFAKAALLEDYLSVINLVQKGYGTGMISEFTLNSLPHSLKICNLVPAITIDIGIVGIDFKNLSPAAKAFQQMLLE